MSYYDDESLVSLDFRARNSESLLPALLWTKCYCWLKSLKDFHVAVAQQHLNAEE